MDILNIEPNDDDEYAEDAELEGELEGEDLEPAQESFLARFAKKKSFKTGVAIASIYTLVLIGDTIGALVTLNGAKPLEYGQGVVTTVSCDTDGIRVAAIARTESPTSDIAFKLDGLKLTGISDACINRIFTISILDGNGNKIKLGLKNMSGSPGSGDDADYAKLYISRDANDANGIDWRVFPATELSDPPSETGLTICGGEFDLSDEINYDFGTSVPKAGCPVNNFLTHWQGFLIRPGTDDGVEHDTEFKLTLTGQALLTISGTNVIEERGNGNERTVTGNYSMLKGTAYPIDLWVFKPTGTHKVILDWDATTGDYIPSSAFQWESSLAVKVLGTEGATDYTVSSTTSTKDDRNFIIHFNKSIPTDLPKRFTIETSRK